jgi:hypothetical protein
MRKRDQARQATSMPYQVVIAALVTTLDLAT